MINLTILINYIFLYNLIISLFIYFQDMSNLANYTNISMIISLWCVKVFIDISIV